MMKGLLSIALCAVLILGLSSCEKANKTDSSNDQFIEGAEYGREEVFIDLVDASPYKKIINFDDVWETEDFSLVLSNVDVKGEPYLKYDLTLHNIKIDECYEDNKMLFNIYSWGNGLWNVVLGYDNYYDYAILENDYPLGGYTATGKTGLYDYDDIEKLVVIIVIDGNVHTAICRLS